MTHVFITARLGSTRLPRKHLLPFGGISVIEHVVRRVQHFGFQPTVCCPETDMEFEKFVPQGVTVYGGHPTDVTERLTECAEKNGIDRFHHLDGDDPFFDDESVRASMHQAARYGIVKPSHYSASGAALCGTSHNLTAKGEEGLQHGSDQPWPVRLTLDYEEDYHLLLAVNRMVGGYMAPRWAVNKLFKDNPDLHKINWFRTDEWKKRQNNEQPGS